MSELGQWLFAKEKETINKLLVSRASRTGIVLTVVAGQRITYTDNTTGQPWAAEVQVVGQMPIVGEPVLIHLLADGNRVAMRMGPNTLPAHAHAAADITSGVLALARIPLHDHAAADIVSGVLVFARLPEQTVWGENTGSGATVGSTTNTSTPQNALSVSITLPIAGSTWDVMAVGDCSFICTVANGRANLNTRIDGTLGTNKTSPPLSTTVYQRGVNSDRVGGIAGNQTIAIDFTYYCAQASTVTAQNPRIVAIAKRAS